MKTPPMPAWPSEVLPCEPAHGFFRRLALCNGALSARSLASAVGLNGRSVRPQDFVEFCTMFPTRNADRLLENTPVADGNRVFLAGETLTISRDIGFQHVRICQACVAEAAYHRSWFDLALVGRCPFHDLPLVAGTESEKLAWWHPDVATTPSGVELRLHGVERTTAPYLSWEAYVLGRLGASEYLSVPLLDEHPLTEVAYLADVIGLSKLVGWTRTEKDRLHKYDPMRGAALQAGFNILAQGSTGLKGHLREIAQDGPYTKLGARTGIFRLYGALRSAVLRMPDFPLAHDLKVWLDEVAAELGVMSRKGRPVAEELPGVAYTLGEVAAALQMTPARARLLVQKLGVSSRLTSKSDRHWISAEGLAHMQNTLANLVLREEACAHLSLSPTEFADVCRANRLAPYIRLGGAGQRWDRYLLSDISSLRDRLA